MLMPTALAAADLQDGFQSAAGDANAPFARVVDRTLDSITVETTDGAQHLIAGEQVIDVGAVPHVVQSDGTAIDMFQRRVPFTVAQWQRQQDADGRSWHYPPASINGVDAANAKGTADHPQPIADPTSVLGRDLSASGATTAPSTTQTETGAALSSSKLGGKLVKLVPWAAIALVIWYLLARRRSA